MIVQAQNKFQSFRDLDGNPLDNGYIYIGTAGSNPETNAIQVYSDSAFTVPVAQPLRTIGGYVVINGSPINTYTNGDYSITVRNGDGSLVYSSLSGNIDPTQESAIQVITDTQVIIDAAVADIDASVASIAAQDAQITANTNALATIGGSSYVPTLSSGSNVQNFSPYSAYYYRVGNMVTVSIEFYCQPISGASGSTVIIPLPIASNISSTVQGAGTAVSTSGFFVGYFSPDATANDMRFYFNTADTTTRTWKGTFTYRII